MSRSEDLASRVEAGANQLADFCEALTEQQWHIIVPQENRSISTLVHHVAWMYGPEMQVADALANGITMQAAGVDWDAVHRMNAAHAGENLAAEKGPTLALLRKAGADAAARIRAYSDAQLDLVSINTLHCDAPLSLQYWIEAQPLKHPYEHLECIKAVLQAQPGTH